MMSRSLTLGMLKPLNCVYQVSRVFRVFRVYRLNGLRPELP